MQEIDFKRFMFEQNIKQKELVEYLGVSKGYISLVIGGYRQLSEENLSKLINNPFGWDTSILTGRKEESKPQNLVEEKPQENSSFERMISLVESQSKIIESLTQLVKDKDEKIEELLYELNQSKKGIAPSAVDSSSASVG